MKATNQPTVVMFSPTKSAFCSHVFDFLWECGVFYCFCIRSVPFRFIPFEHFVYWKSVFKFLFNESVFFVVLICCFIWMKIVANVNKEKPATAAATTTPETKLNGSSHFFTTTTATFFTHSSIVMYCFCFFNFKCGDDNMRLYLLRYVCFFPFSSYSMSLFF